MSNAIGAVKVLTLIFIGLTGLIVLGGHTRVENPTANFKDAFRNFDGPPGPYGLTNALYRIIFSYAGYANAFNVVNEVKNPVKSLKRNGFFSLVVVAILYLLANVAYFASGRCPASFDGAMIRWLTYWHSEPGRYFEWWPDRCELVFHKRFWC